MATIKTRTFVATFLNKKKLEVVCNYDRERRPKDCVKINLRSVLPVFGESMPPDVNEFVSTFAMRHFLYKNVKLHRCEGGTRSPCAYMYRRYEDEDSAESSEEDLEAELDICPHHHFHHYCPKHVLPNPAP